MNLTDISVDAYDGEESPPNLDELESPDSLFKRGSIRERLLDIVVGLRTPTRVSTIAERADCDTETARDYLIDVEMSKSLLIALHTYRVCSVVPSSLLRQCSSQDASLR
jgi:hypothetical protein